MIVRTILPGIGEIRGTVVQCLTQTYARPDESIYAAPKEHGHLRVRFTLPWEREVELRQHRMETWLDCADNGMTKLVASYAEVPAKDCETVSATLEELETFSCRGYQTRNSERMLGDKKLNDIGEKLEGIRRQLNKR